MFVLVVSAIMAAFVGTGAVALLRNRSGAALATANGARVSESRPAATGPRAAVPAPEGAVEPAWTTFVRGL